MGPPALKLRRVNRRKKVPEIEEEADWVKDDRLGSGRRWLRLTKKGREIMDIVKAGDSHPGGANHMVDRSPSAETRDSLLGNIFGRIFFIKNFLNCGESFLSNCRWESEIWNLA